MAKFEVVVRMIIECEDEATAKKVAANLGAFVPAVMESDWDTVSQIEPSDPHEEPEYIREGY